MGRNPGYGRRTVEECKAVSVKFLRKLGYFRKLQSGTITWSCQGQEIGSMEIEAKAKGSERYLRVHYSHTNRRTGEKTDHDYNIQLVSSPCNLGGKRWWFVCPLTVDDIPCGRRVGALYFAGGPYLGCRHCYDLTYRSCQESHKFDLLYLQCSINPKKAKKMDKNELWDRMCSNPALFQRTYRHKTQVSRADTKLFKKW